MHASPRIEATDGDLNALPTLCIERARDHARKLMAQPPRDSGRGPIAWTPHRRKGPCGCCRSTVNQRLADIR